MRRESETAVSQRKSKDKSCCRATLLPVTKSFNGASQGNPLDGTAALGQREPTSSQKCEGSASPRSTRSTRSYAFSPTEQLRMLRGAILTLAELAPSIRLGAEKPQLNPSATLLDQPHQLRWNLPQLAISLQPSLLPAYLWSSNTRSDATTLYACIFINRYS